MLLFKQLVIKAEARTPQYFCFNNIVVILDGEAFCLCTTKPFQMKNVKKKKVMLHYL